MNIKVRHIGYGGDGKRASGIEVIVTSHDGNHVMTEDVTFADGYADEDLIFQLREVACALEVQNKKEPR